MEGVLQKRRRRIFGMDEWQTFYFILDCKMLHFHDIQEEHPLKVKSTPHGSIFLHKCSVDAEDLIHHGQPTNHSFTITNARSSLHLSAATAALKDIWVHKVTAAIALSMKEQQKLSSSHQPAWAGGKPQRDACTPSLCQQHARDLEPTLPRERSPSREREDRERSASSPPPFAGDPAPPNSGNAVGIVAAQTSASSHIRMQGSFQRAISETNERNTTQLECSSSGLQQAGHPFAFFSFPTLFSFASMI
jgi:hypothetical protein